MKKSVCGSLTLLLVGLLFLCSVTYAAGSHITIEIIKNNDVASVKKAIEEGADVDATVEDLKYQNSPITKNYSLLMVAAKSNALLVAELLINSGANVNQKVEGFTALDYAIEAKSFEIVRLLLEHGAIVNPVAQNAEVPNNPLEEAVDSNDPQIVKLLIEKGANVRDSSLPLFSAAYSNSVEIAKILVENGADLNEATTDGRTPLMIAVEQGSYEMVRFLLEKGADVSRKDSHGDTVVQYASGDKKMIDLLLQSGVKISSIQYALSKVGFIFNEFTIFLSVSVLFVLFVVWILVAAKTTRKTNIFIIRFVIRIFGLLLILFPLPLALMFSMGGRGTPPPAWFILMLSLIGLFISGFGMVILMKWSWYSAMILLPIFTIDGIYFLLPNSLSFDNFLIAFSFPIVLFIFLLIPKVKEQFK